MRPMAPFPAAARTFFSKVHVVLDSLASDSGTSGKIALDVDRGVVVPAVLLGDDAVAGEDEPAADDTRAGSVDGGEITAAAGEIDAMRRSDDLEPDGLLEIRPQLERDLLEPAAVVAALLEAGLLHLGGHVFGRAAVLGCPGFAALEGVRSESGDVSEGLPGVGRGPENGSLGGGLARGSGGGEEGEGQDEQGEEGSGGAGGDALHGVFLCSSVFRASVAALPNPSETVG
jgi:hypothetical protein